MSRGVNKAIIIGNCTIDPDVKYTAGGSAIVNISVATNETWKDKNTGETQERAEFHRIVIFGKLAEIAAQYLKKGSQVYFEGRIQTRKWQGQDGQDRYTTEIVANEMQLLGSRGDSDMQSGQDKQRERPPAQPQPSQPDDGFNDIPFVDPYKFTWRSM